MKINILFEMQEKILCELIQVIYYFMTILISAMVTVMLKIYIFSLNILIKILINLNIHKFK